jgi:hypothetical protein
MQPARDLPTARNRTNILYIPTKKASNKKFEFSADVSREDIKKFLSRQSDFPAHYDFSITTLLLDHLCDKPAKAVEAVCGSDLSGGPSLLCRRLSCSSI